MIVSVGNRHGILDPLLRLVRFFLGRSFAPGERVAELEAAGFKVLDTVAILHGPRLVPALSVGLARKLGWRWLNRQVHRLRPRAQAPGGARWECRTVSLLTALGEVRK